MRFKGIVLNLLLYGFIFLSCSVISSYIRDLWRVRSRLQMDDQHADIKYFQSQTFEQYSENNNEEPELKVIGDGALEFQVDTNAKRENDRKMREKLSSGKLDDWTRDNSKNSKRTNQEYGENGGETGNSNINKQDIENNRLDTKRKNNADNKAVNGINLPRKFKSPDILVDGHKYTKEDAKQWPAKRQWNYAQHQIVEFRPRPLTNADYRSDQKDPYILIWSANKLQTSEADRQLNKKYPDVCGGCIATMDRSIHNRSSAIIIFNSPENLNPGEFPDPKTRTKNQLYVFWNRETPSKCIGFKDKLKDKRINGIFNLTMNYRTDSSIQYFFGNIESAIRDSKSKGDEFWENMGKRKIALWMVSNCNRTRGARDRMQYAVDMMDAGLDLDVKGLCFAEKRDKIFKQTIENYKFYLAFENSIHCPDYVTEKLWRNGFQGGAVPIVWGPSKEDVRAIAPPNSYIHAEDFESPKELVKYLKYLDANETAYREYHKWREATIDPQVHYADIKAGTESAFCRLCKIIRNLRPTDNYRIPSVYKWLYETNYIDDQCLTSEI